VSANITGFVCNLCGGKSPHPGTVAPGRETPSCDLCGSTTRLRGLVALLSREILGVELALPSFHSLKGIRGLGMSDPPALAARLAVPFDYLNTFYHQPPSLTCPPPSFILRIVITCTGVRAVIRNLGLTTLVS
jgi:hypothetical protein